MNTKHTPGPWFVPHLAREIDCNCGYVFAEAQSGMGAICEVTFGGEDEPLEVAAANARLIAAAPELLEALEYIAGLTGYANCDACNEVSNTARAAIAKATGESA